MQRQKQQAGSTLVEVLFVVWIVVVMGGFFGTLMTANFWFFESGVLRELKLEHPNVVAVEKTERCVWAYSQITVRNQDGTRSTYKLDSNLLFNYRFK